MTKIRNKMLSVLILLVCLLVFLPFTCQTPRGPSQAERPIVALDMKAGQVRLHLEYSQRIDKLILVNDSLQRLVFQSRILLESQRAKTKGLKEDFEKALDAYIDTCDQAGQLKAISTNFIHASEIADSLCMSALIVSDSLLHVKDEVIDACRAHAIQTDSLLNLSITKQIELEKELITQIKKDKKRKRRTLALAGVLAGVSLGLISGR